jgi:hypothetical protein
MRHFVALTIAVVSVGCFNPTYNNPMCSPSGECPDGLTCGADNVCRAAGVIDAAPIDAGADAIMIDAMPPDALPPGQCDPVGQDCPNVGDKCGRVELSGVITIECYANGNVAAEGACVIDANGHDDCRGGLACVGGRCQEMCTLVPDSCGSGGACLQYAGVYDGTGFDGSLGLCTPTCDPVTQLMSDGASCGAGRACYGSPNGPFFCASEIDPAARHGTVISPPVYLNSCAGGFMPFNIDPTDSNNRLCAALCRPQQTSSTDPSGAGGVPGSGFTCADRNANTAECRFISAIQDMGAPGFGDHDDVGWCLEYTASGQPSCTTLPDGDQANGCAPY